MASFTLVIPSQGLYGVSLVSQNGRRWTFPAVPPEADHEFPGIAFEEISRPDANPVNVAKGRTLHKISMNWKLAYPDDRSIEADLQELRGFASDGKWFTINYTPSWGGWWLITEPLRVSQSMLNSSNEITQAMVTLGLKRATQITTELAPVKADGSTDIPIITRVEVPGGADPTNPQFQAPVVVGGGGDGSGGVGDPGLGVIGN